MFLRLDIFSIEVIRRKTISQILFAYFFFWSPEVLRYIFLNWFSLGAIQGRKKELIIYACKRRGVGMPFQSNG